MRLASICGFALASLLAIAGVAQAGLVAHYQMEQASSPLLDSVSSASAAEAGTGCLYQQAGVSAGTYGAITRTNSTGYAVGQNDKNSRWNLSAADSAAMNLANDFTVMGWFYLPNQPSDPNPAYNLAAICGRAQSWAARGYGLFVRNAEGAVGINYAKNGQAEWYSGSPISWDHEWHHIAATQSSTAGISLYLDGNLVGSFTDAAATNNVTLLSATEGYAIGGANAGSVSQTVGQQIDEFRVYNTVLTRDEIIVAAQQPVPEPSTLTLIAAALVGLLAYAWRKRK